jgi:hypothetical protein
MPKSVRVGRLLAVPSGNRRFGRHEPRCALDHEREPNLEGHRMPRCHWHVLQDVIHCWRLLQDVSVHKVQWQVELGNLGDSILFWIADSSPKTWIYNLDMIFVFLWQLAL